MRRSALVAVLLLCACRQASAQTTINANAYLDKLEGMWLGECIGDYAGDLREGSCAVGGINYQVNWTDPNHIDPVTGQNDYVFRDSSWVGVDDTVFEYLDMNYLQTNANPTSAQVGQLWVSTIPDNNFYIANRQSIHLLHEGMSAPNTGSINNNVWWNAIDSQIETESLGAIAPGMVQRAVNLAGTFGSVTNSGYALQAAQYYAAMYSAAATESNVCNLVAIGQSIVPKTSRTWQVIQDVRNWYADSNLDWEATQALIYSKYCTNSQGRYLGYFESSINCAMTTLALLYGGGDFEKTVDIAVQAGFNGDCNAGTAAGLIGMIEGYSGLPADVIARAGTGYIFPSIMSGAPSQSNLATIAAGFQADTESQILLMGGSITGTGANRTYNIPSVPLAPLVEKPDPTGPKGLVGQLLAMGGSVTVTASRAHYDTSNDRTNLNSIISGITDVSYDGHLAYWTNDGAPVPPGGDFFQLNLSRLIDFSSVIYYEGDIQLGAVNSFVDSNTVPPAGGWFTNLTVEVGTNGVFGPVNNLVFSEPLDPNIQYQVITLSFDPIEGNSVRIRGTPGGTSAYVTCLQLEAYGSIPGAAGNQWTSPAGNWADPNCWTAGLPGPALGAIIGNGGAVTIDQPGMACDSLVVGNLSQESGTVSMTAGRMDSNWVAVGMGGAGTFNQSGGAHVVRQNLYIAHDANASGSYALQDGNLTVGGGVFVGGSDSSAGGSATLSVTGGRLAVVGLIKVWGGGSLSLGLDAAGFGPADPNNPGCTVVPHISIAAGGQVVLAAGSLCGDPADANLLTSIDNAGLIHIASGSWRLASVECPDSNLPAGIIEIDAGATLTVGTLDQEDVYVSGTLILDAALNSLAAPWTPDQLAPDDSASVPEPATLALLVLAAPALLRRKRAGRGRNIVRLWDRETVGP